MKQVQLRNSLRSRLMCGAVMFGIQCSMALAQDSVYVITPAGDTLRFMGQSPSSLVSQMAIDENGNGSNHVWPPPDSAFVPNHLIIKFKEGQLDYSQLCYGGYPVMPLDSNGFRYLDTALKAQVMAQSFPIDSGIVLNIGLADAIKSYGGVRLRRITCANPCKDTVSVARNGDSIRIDDYNWMLLELNNDTSAVAAALYLSENYIDQIERADVNRIGEFTVTEPNDTEYQLGRQISMGLIGAQTAWDFQKGNYGVKVGVVDNGVDFYTPDLGWGIGAGLKVRGGWNWENNSWNFSTGSSHGTPVTGIIGAYSQNMEGVAGIAGGWTGGGGGVGTQIIGLKIGGAQPREDYVIAAIREASAYNPATGYGYGVHILNNSYTIGNQSENLRSAVNAAFQQGVSFVASRGNSGGTDSWYPQGVDSRWAVSVGAGDRDRNRIDYSSYGSRLDLIAPGGRENIPTQQIVRTTALGGGYRWFSGTSAAAPHVSGVIALLRAQALARGWSNLEPEDYEGMLMASAGDRTFNSSFPETYDYLTGYDAKTGWGHLQADRIYNMFSLGSTSGYRVSHYTQNSGLNYGSWGGVFTADFVNGGRSTHYLPTGRYYVRQRLVSGTINLPTTKWDLSKQLYVWGRSGTTGGYGGGVVNYQSLLTMVTTGRGNNSTNTLQPGIWHGHSLSVGVQTYQYEVWDAAYRYVGIFPPNNRLGFSISAFGHEWVALNKPTARQSGINNDRMHLEIYPNPTTDAIAVRYRLGSPAVVQVELYNSLGQNILVQESPLRESAGVYEEQVLLGDISAGVYLCKVTSGEGVSVQQIVVQK